MLPADLDDATVPTRAPGRPREAATEAAIIDAALSLMDEQCYSEITIEKIASRAGVGKPTIYRRWRTKADVVLHAFAIRAANRGAPVPPSEDAFSDLQVFLERLFIATNHPVNMRAVRCFIAESQFDDDFRRKFYDLFLSKRREAMRNILQHGQALGQIRRDLDLEVACDLLYGAFSARLINGILPLDAAFATSIVDLLKHGFEASSTPSLKPAASPA
jgi:AcrR family transcriptional regulator